MTTKAKCFKLAKEHNLEIEYSVSGKYDLHYSVNLPEGFQMDEWDDRQGLCSHAESKKELWQGIYGDLLEIISYKPWLELKD